MKKTLLLLGLILLPAALFAQGTVDFQNTSATRITTNSTATPPPGQAANATGFNTGLNTYTFALYIAPQGTTDPLAFTLMGPTTPNQQGGPGGQFNGRFNGNPGATSFIVSNNTGQAIAFQVRAWSTYAGADYAAALAYNGANAAGRYLGSSTIGEVSPATGLLLAPALFGTAPGQVGAFQLTPIVPEPSSIALGLLGLGAIALFRRRR